MERVKAVATHLVRMCEGVFRAGSLNDIVTTENLSKTYGSILVRVCRVDGQQASNGSSEDLKLNETRNRLVSPVA